MNYYYVCTKMRIRRSAGLQPRRRPQGDRAERQRAPPEERHMTISGGCLCGAVRYAISGAIGPTGNCHCSICRRAHGAAFATWAFVDPGQFRDRRRGSPRTHSSSPGKERCFCIASRVAARTDRRRAALRGRPGERLRRPWRSTRRTRCVGPAPWYETADALAQFERLPVGLKADAALHKKSGWVRAPEPRRGAPLLSPGRSPGYGRPQREQP